jgi:hypothetical protein
VREREKERERRKERDKERKRKKEREREWLPRGFFIATVVLFFFSFLLGGEK